MEKDKIVDKELKQMKTCLKDKDERIGVLETSLEYLGKKREDIIRWFNCISIFAFTGAIAVLIMVYYYFYPDWFNYIAGHVAIIGTIVMVINFLICLNGYFIFDIEHDNVVDMLFKFNFVIVPIMVGVYFYAMGWVVLS